MLSDSSFVVCGSPHLQLSPSGSFSTKRQPGIKKTKLLEQKEIFITSIEVSG